MNVARFITLCLFLPVLAACQYWTNSIEIPPESAPPPSVAADATREKTPAAPFPARTTIPTSSLTAAIEAYISDATNRIAEDGDTLAFIDKRSSDGVAVDVWERIRRGFKLEHHLNRRSVQAELNWYRRHPAYLDRVAERARRHLFHIVEIVEERDLPLEIALLPIVESAYDPFAYSHGRAAGLWQFIPGTARHYGLEMDWWYDGRRDVSAATRAAITYLEHLHQLLNDDWLLALAAYNAGQGNVRHAIRANSRAGKPGDFWSLRLVPETRVYVPRLLAISALIANPQKYDIELASIPNEPYWEAVDIGSQLDLAKAASLADISIDELYRLNPAFNRWSTRPDGPHRLLIPKPKAEGFRQRLNTLPVDQRVSWRRHTVQPGDTLGLIAQRHQTSIAAIKTANNLRGNVIRIGDALLIPVASHGSDAYSLSKESRLEHTRTYLEDKHGMEPTRYTVRRGDSLWEIARRFGVKVRKLAKWNGMAPTDVLKPDTELVLFVASAPEVSSPPPKSKVIRKVNYRVRTGESLALIANKFNLTVARIKEWNEYVTQRKYIQPGDQLTLFVDVTAMQ